MAAAPQVQPPRSLRTSRSPSLSSPRTPSSLRTPRSRSPPSTISRLRRAVGAVGSHAARGPDGGEDPAVAQSGRTPLSPGWIAFIVLDVVLVAIVIAFAINLAGGSDGRDAPQGAGTVAESPAATPEASAAEPDASAAITGESITTPSKNITCTLGEQGVSCGIAELASQPAPVEGCKGTTGYMVTLTAEGVDIPCVRPRISRRRPEPTSPCSTTTRPRPSGPSRAPARRPGCGAPTPRRARASTSPRRPVLLLTRKPGCDEHPGDGRRRAPGTSPRRRCPVPARGPGSSCSRHQMRTRSSGARYSASDSVTPYAS
ncbi:hypothetical protein NKG05_01775 [Oerskovia sp. M15]